MSAQETASQHRSMETSVLLRRGVIALVVAVVGNLLVTAVGIAAGLAPGFAPLSYGPVALFTALGVVGAVVVYALLGRIVEKPGRTFTVLAAVVLVVSLIPDVTFAPTLPGATTAGIVALMVTHVVAAAVCVAVLTGRVGGDL